MDPQDATEYDSPNPPHKLEDFVNLVASMIDRDRSMGDNTEVLDIAEDGRYGLRLKMASGQIFLIRVGLESQSTTSRALYMREHRKKERALIRQARKLRKPKVAPDHANG